MLRQNIGKGLASPQVNFALYFARHWTCKIAVYGEIGIPGGDPLGGEGAYGQSPFPEGHSVVRCGRLAEPGACIGTERYGGERFTACYKAMSLPNREMSGGSAGQTW